MKPKTKKTLIIMAAVLAIAVIVWLLFFRKKEWERILDRLTIDENIKAEIRAEARRIDQNPALRQAVAAEAAEVYETYDRWLIMTAAMNLRYPVQSNQLGQIIINPKD
ncbi:MAG: hypothetical protein IJQ83_07315 [Bacteroidales bacterium]|nr:hypothetical protein [Bacteroidales bacterium]